MHESAENSSPKPGVPAPPGSSRGIAFPAKLFVIREEGFLFPQEKEGGHRDKKLLDDLPAAGLLPLPPMPTQPFLERPPRKGQKQAPGDANQGHSTKMSWKTDSENAELPSGAGRHGEEYAF